MNINSRSTKYLHPVVANKANQLILDCQAKSIDIIITSTYRNFESQQALYNQGRTTKGTIVTNAKPGFSAHNWKLAFDICPIVNGKAFWDTSPKNMGLWNVIGKLGENLGLDWAGRWRTFKEYVHFQYLLESLSLEQLRKIYPKGLPDSKDIKPTNEYIFEDYDEQSQDE
jgi:peptidoglycan L-alanyl-D-glutamate endopeptidase CwlK